jgi:hypothetical protein
LRDLRGVVANQRRLLLYRAILTGAFLASAMLVGFMQFTHVASAEVVVEVRTRGVFFTLADRAAFHAAQLRAVLISGVVELTANSREIRVVPPKRAEGRPDRRSTQQVNPNPYVPLIIRASSEATPQISLSGSDLGLVRLDLQRRTPIEIRPDEGPQSSTVTIRHGAPTTAVVGTGKRVTVGCMGCDLVQKEAVLARVDAQLMIVPQPREVQVQSKTGGIDMALVLSGNGDAEGTGQSLRLNSIDFTSSETGNLESLIQEATVRIVDLDDKPILLGKRDFLDIDDIDDLVVSQLVLGPTIVMRLEGRVGSLRTGAGRTLHSRIPTRLQWAAANRPLALFIAGVSGVFGFLAAAASRLGIIKSD